MAKLYVFGIGGTGSRVIHSLTMLLASGVKLGHGFDTLVPVIIDPDSANGDLDRTKKALLRYNEVRNAIHAPDGFFAQNINSVSGVNGTSNLEGYHLHMGNSHGKRFRDYIEFDKLTREQQLFVKMMFSERNLDARLDEGFKGNPNMGVIVLFDILNSPQFHKFELSYQDGDAIFIISSIFGGTGAAGFPLLLKKLRSGGATPNGQLIQEAPIGAISYLPYFNIREARGSIINSRTFKEKSKIAFDYYLRTHLNPTHRILNAFYYLAHDSEMLYENHEGSKEQKNPAHFLEVAGALGILDFCADAGHYKNNENGHCANPTVSKEFGIHDYFDSINFQNLEINEQNLIRHAHSAFHLMHLYLEKGLQRAKNVSRWTKKKTLLTNTFFEADLFIKKLVGSDGFLKLYENWITELGLNSPAFAPFRPVERSSALSFVADRTPKPPLFSGGKSFKSVDIANCLNIDSVDNTSSSTQFIKLFSTSTRKVNKSARIAE